MSTGWEREKRIHFDEIVEGYDRIRPEYPAALFEEVRNYCQSTSGKNALEIGAGTGKATLPFLQGGYTVTAIELSANMSAFLLNRFHHYPAFHVITNSFEDAILSEGDYDLLYAASAFHWVDPKIGCPKAFRLLSKGGCLALLRYNWMEDSSRKIKAVQEAYERCYFTYYKKPPFPPPDKTKELFVTKEYVKKNFGFEEMEAYGFRDVTMKFFDAEGFYTADEYVAILDTMSDYRALPDENRLPLYESIHTALVENNNSCKINYCFQLYMGRKPDSRISSG